MKNNLDERCVLVVGPHPDDESLGCGGTLLAYRQAGIPCHWCLVTDASEADGYPAAQIQRLNIEVNMVAKQYGFASVHRLHIPTTRVDTVPMGERIRVFSQVLQAVRPTEVYLPFAQDPHSDHRHTFEAAYSTLKTFRAPWVRKVLMMEIPSETDFALPLQPCAFLPTVFQDISPYLEEKIQIMGHYSTELGEHPFPRSAENIRAWAHVRGAQAGMKAAEAFMLLKEIRHLPTNCV